MAIDPVIAKLLTQAVITAASDKETRQKMIIMILVPVISFLLLVALILYIITSPSGLLFRGTYPTHKTVGNICWYFAVIPIRQNRYKGYKIVQ